MSNLTLRSNKGSKLTFTEMDNNFLEAAKGGTRNLCLNGDFSVSQEIIYPPTGSNPHLIQLLTPANRYIFDNWRAFDNSTDGLSNIYQQPFTVGQTDVPGNPRYYLRWEQLLEGTGAAKNVRFYVEDVTRTAGEVTTLSFYAKAAVATDIDISTKQDFGTSGSPAVVTDIDTITLSTTWARYTSTFTWPSATGKTLGTTLGHSQVLFGLPLSGKPDVSLANVQLEYGDVATAFERIPAALTLALAQRYYECSTYGMYNVSNISAIGAVAAPQAGSFSLAAAVNFAATKATTPTVTLYSTAGTKNCVSALTSDTTENDIGATVGQPNYMGFSFINTTEAAPGFGRFHWTADARLV